MSKYIETDKLKQMVEHKMDMQDFYLPVQFLEVVDDMPAADVVEVRHYLSEWCTDCKEYDKERHCCPRFNRVIKETVAEMKSDGWQKVRHGRWLEHREGRWIYAECSACNSVQDTKTNYCPNCGAKMNEVEAND